MLIDTKFWQGKRVLITGHTGFKGSWISLWLNSLGVELLGIALEPPTYPSLFVEANISKLMISEITDIRNLDNISNIFKNFRPEIVIHLAAQPLVIESYKDPITTYTTNVIGTLNILESARQTDSVRAIVNVTTDKCYENKEWVWGYRENESLGGFDPYSNSKSCSELLTSSYRNSFFSITNVGLATARAGNVIGGGDWARNRLIPDILRSFENNSQIEIRNPLSIRPWQHVLEPLSGYLILAEKLFNDSILYSEGWNFGPNDEDAKSVEWIVNTMIRSWGASVNWTHTTEEYKHEANYLKLDISKANNRLDWHPRWALSTALDKIIEWQRAWKNNENMSKFCLQQIEQYNLS